MDFCHCRLPARVDLFPEPLGHLRHALLNPEATAASFLRLASSQTVHLLSIQRIPGTKWRCPVRYDKALLFQASFLSLSGNRFW